MMTYYSKQGTMQPSNWQELESAEAKSLRGRGWSTFVRTIRKERGEICPLCDSVRNLEAHHIFPVRFFRHLRFERWNVIILCQRCHKLAEEAGASVRYALYRFVEYHTEGA